MKVGELIEKLKAFPADRRVTLCDPDTGWYLAIELEDDKQENGEPLLLVTGNYSRSEDDLGEPPIR